MSAVRGGSGSLWRQTCLSLITAKDVTPATCFAGKGLKAESLLKQLDLYSRRNDAIRTYSRGMLQRISIARALIHSPEIIFLDEPYTGLDSLAGNKLSNLLKEQLSHNKTILMVTHDIHTGLDLASNVIIMKSGKIVFNKLKSEIDTASFEQMYLDVAGNKDLKDELL